MEIPGERAAAAPAPRIAPRIALRSAPPREASPVSLPSQHSPPSRRACGLSPLLAVVKITSLGELSDDDARRLLALERVVECAMCGAAGCGVPLIAARAAPPVARQLLLRLRDYVRLLWNHGFFGQRTNSKKKEIFSWFVGS